LVPGTTLVLIKKFYEVEVIWVFGPVQIPKETFFEFFSSISCGLCTVTKCENVVLFGFSIGTKGEKLNFYATNILNSPLVPVLNPKSTTFPHLVTVQRPKI
jgi:hypothetical protein